MEINWIISEGLYIHIDRQEELIFCSQWKVFKALQWGLQNIYDQVLSPEQHKHVHTG